MVSGAEPLFRNESSVENPSLSLTELNRGKSSKSRESWFVLYICNRYGKGNSSERDSLYRILTLRQLFRRYAQLRENAGRL